MQRTALTIRGRGAGDNPPNRFVPIRFAPDPDVDPADQPAPATQFFNTSRSIIAHNDSPDVGFTASINPYRGCEHGCIYCYARPTHEYFGLSAGLDFETKIFVKQDAPELLRKELASPRWQPQVLSISGVTDPYQPIERKLQLTRRCLQVLAEFRNPFGIVTKSALVARDVDILSDMSRDSAAAVFLSVTTLDADLSRKLEPRAAHPQRRLSAIRELSRAGVPVGVMVAPLIPALTDHELPAILRAAADAGARCAGFVPMRLPGAVAGLFQDWVQKHFPDRAAKVLNRIRSVRGGKLNDPNFGTRMRGEGPFAQQMAPMFKIACRKAGIANDFPDLSTASFRLPAASHEPTLFD